MLSHATTHFLEGFLQGSLTIRAFRRVLRRRLQGVLSKDKVLRRDLTRERFIEGA